MSATVVATTPSPSKPLYKLPSDAVWFITGCSSGLGLSLARLIAAHPTQRLVATARRADRLRSLFPDSADRVLIVELDVTSSESIEAAIDAVLKNPNFGRIDVLGMLKPFYHFLVHTYIYICIHINPNT